MSRVEVTYQARWRRRGWPAEFPSREAWFVTCPEHPQLGRDSSGERWGYTTSGRAHGVATRHQRTKHQARTT